MPNYLHSYELTLGMRFKETSLKFILCFLLYLYIYPFLPLCQLYNVLLKTENLNPVLMLLITFAYLSLLLSVICSANRLKKDVHSGPVPPDVVKINGMKVPFSDSI